MTVGTISFPANVLSVGAAIEPLDPPSGLRRALAIVGEMKIRSISETLAAYQGRPVDEVLGDIAGAWSTASQPMMPAINHLRTLGASAVVTALAARLFVKSDEGYNVAALAALSPGVRALTGLPTSSEIELAKQRYSSATE